MTLEQVQALTLGNVEAWLMLPERTVDDLVTVSGVVKLECERRSFAGQTQLAFSASASLADTAQRAKFPG